MLDFTLVGELNLAQGVLGLRRVPCSNLSMLFLQRDDLGATLSLLIDPKELGVLISSLEKSPSIAAAAPPGAGMVTAWWAPRPMGARLFVIHQQGGAVAVLIRFFQRDHNFDALLEREQQAALLNWCQQRLVELREQNLPVESGRLALGGKLTLKDGRQPEFLQGLTHFWGPYGELFQAPETCEDCEVLVECAQVEGKTFALRVQVVRETPAPTAQEQDATFAKFCQQGRESDVLLRAGHFRSAFQARNELLDAMKGSGKVDSFLMCKVALSHLLNLVLAGEMQSGFALWRSADSPDDLLGLGVMMLEKGQTSNFDMVLYRMIESVFHSLNADSGQGLQAVNKLMTVAVRFAADLEDRWLRAMILRNWRLLLNEVFDGEEIPPKALQPLAAAQQAFPVTVMPKVFCFPWPDAWAITWESEEVMRIGPQGVTASGAGNRTETSRPWWKRLFGLQ